MSSRSKLTGWGDALLDAAVVAAVGTGFIYLGGDRLVGMGIEMITQGMIPAVYAGPVSAGIIIGTTVFITDLVYMYKYKYN